MAVRPKNAQEKGDVKMKIKKRFENEVFLKKVKKRKNYKNMVYAFIHKKAIRKDKRK